MRIAIVGAQNTGKTTLFNAFKQNWPMYETPKKSYRDLIKEKNLSLNENGSMQSQQIILDVLVDLALDNAGKEKTLHDRCVLDNVVYSLWLSEYDKLGESSEKISEFIANSINVARESLKFYDIIFWLPLNKNIPIVDAENRSQNEQYREEIDNIFHGVYSHYKSNSGVLFDKDDQPAFIPLEGELADKLATIREYINEDGKLVETTNSVLSDLESIYDEAALLNQVKGGK